MKISRQEQLAISAVVQIGKAHGFGNMISHLKAAWAKSLIDQGFTQTDAHQAVNGGYSIEMHTNLLEKGEHGN